MYTLQISFDSVTDMAYVGVIADLMLVNLEIAKESDITESLFFPAMERVIFQAVDYLIAENELGSLTTGSLPNGLTRLALQLRRLADECDALSKPMA